MIQGDCMRLSPACVFCQLPTGQSAVPHGLFEGACLVLTLQSNAYTGYTSLFSLTLRFN